MSTTRVVKAYESITMKEVALSDGQSIIRRAYSVLDASDLASPRQFGDMGAADAYFDELVVRRQNPKK